MNVISEINNAAALAIQQSQTTHIDYSGLLAEAFGKKVGEIGQMVEHYNFKEFILRQTTSRDVGSEDFLHCDLAPCYGTLDKGTIQDMDLELKVMIAATMKYLAKLEDKSWRNVLASMSQNVLLEPEGEPIARTTSFTKESVSQWKFDGSPQSTIVQEVKTWFNKLISDDDVLQSTRIGINVLADIVASTGATVDSFEAVFMKDEYHERTLVDIGVLRFPDISHPYFKLYRIKLVAYSDSRRILFAQTDRNGITGEYNCRTFKPRKSVIENMTERALASAAATAESLFP
ncbi:hypothetical protein QBC39DRAFT_384922 [Podospora conica]|nr:hypothetical protein QBC39DRAFT_384922 [Schizothecium conicum]